MGKAGQPRTEVAHTGDYNTRNGHLDRQQRYHQKEAFGVAPMARMTRALIGANLIVLYSFGIVSGAAISYAMEHRQEEAEAHAVMVNLMTHSLRDLGEIQVRSL